jgi:hypothetical protein
LTEGDPKVNYFCVDEEGTVWFKDHLVVPKNHGLCKKIFDEPHTSKYSIHPGSTKIFHDFKAQFWWTCMKCETARYVAECDTCQRVKADHMRHAGLLQPLSIPAWKWEDISMGFNSIWVIVDRFTVSAHFILVHGVLKTIISDPGPQFVAHFWEQLLTSLGMHLIHSSAYHLQTDGQIERVNQILEDML